MRAAWKYKRSPFIYGEKQGVKGASLPNSNKQSRGAKGGQQAGWCAAMRLPLYFRVCHHEKLPALEEEEATTTTTQTSGVIGKSTKFEFEWKWPLMG
jgi:hypothetical protein